MHTRKFRSEQVHLFLYFVFSVVSNVKKRGWSWKFESQPSLGGNQEEDQSEDQQDEAIEQQVQLLSTIA